jgi:hypothetical protein
MSIVIRSCFKKLRGRKKETGICIHQVGFEDFDIGSEISSGPFRRYASVWLVTLTLSPGGFIRSSRSSFYDPHLDIDKVGFPGGGFWAQVKRILNLRKKRNGPRICSLCDTPSDAGVGCFFVQEIIN